MEQSPITPPETRAEDQNRPPEELIQGLVQELQRLSESGRRPEVIERFGGLHPVDQGEVLDGLSRYIQQSLIADLDHSVLADIWSIWNPRNRPSCWAAGSPPIWPKSWT